MPTTPDRLRRIRQCPSHAKVSQEDSRGRCQPAKGEGTQARIQVGSDYGHHLVVGRLHKPTCNLENVKRGGDVRRARE